MNLSFSFFIIFCSLYFDISNVYSSESGSENHSSEENIENSSTVYEYNDGHDTPVSGEVFYPITHQWQLEKCREKYFSFQYRSARVHSSKPIGKPKIIRKIPGLASCLFNALSYAITGSTKYGQELRNKILDFMENSETHGSQDWQKTRIHTMRTNYMEYGGSEEITGAADYLRTSIYIYYEELGEWLFYSKDGFDGEKLNEPSIYLFLSNEHYDYVIDVEHDQHIPTYESQFMPVLESWQSEKASELLESAEVSKILFEEETITPLNNGVIEVMEYIPTDGNSLFNSLSYCITGTTDHSAKLRQLVVDSMHHSGVMKTIFNDESTLEKRIEEISQDQASVDGPILYAVSELLNTSIYVYNQDDQDWDFVSKYGLGGEEVREHCIYLKNFDQCKNIFTVVNVTNY